MGGCAPRPPGWRPAAAWRLAAAARRRLFAIVRGDGQIVDQVEPGAGPAGRESERSVILSSPGSWALAAPAARVAAAPAWREIFVISLTHIPAVAGRGKPTNDRRSTM